MNKFFFAIALTLFSSVACANELDLFFKDIPSRSKVVKIECYINGSPSQKLRLDEFEISKDQNGIWGVALFVDQTSARRKIENQSQYEILFSGNQKRIDIYGLGPIISVVFNGIYSSLVITEKIPRWNQEDAIQECTYFSK